MTKVRRNIIARGMSSSPDDQLLIRRSRPGRTIVGNQAAFRADRAFREAAAYAQSAQEHPAYLQQTKILGICPYNLALADWFHMPEVLEIDLAAWDGQAGQPIRILAVDDVRVTRVSVVIVDESDVVIEHGEAARVDCLWWQYVTSAAAAGSPKVLVSARDLPGHVAVMKKVKS
jgi:hypothetical protein